VRPRPRGGGHPCFSAAFACFNGAAASLPRNCQGLEYCRPQVNHTARAVVVCTDTRDLNPGN